ncbi:tail fiber assembly protein [Escherichia coli]
MMHLKNITAGNPKTKEQYQLTKQFNIKWLYSEDGKNWYEEQKNFQPDTLKMVYDHNGVIICIEKDVSAINPEGASVVELPDITANRRADISGRWMFKDDVVVKRTYTEEEQRQQAENEKQSLLQLVRDKTQLWDSQLRLGIISDDWININRVFCSCQCGSTANPEWPVTFPNNLINRPAIGP